MRPVPIPDDQIPAGSVRRVISGPDGDLTGPIMPIEAAVIRLPRSGEVAYMVRCEPEEGDLETLARGGAVWITFLGHVVPFALEVGP